MEHILPWEAYGISASQENLRLLSKPKVRYHGGGRHDGEGNKHLWNVGQFLRAYTARRRRRQSSSFVFAPFVLFPPISLFICHLIQIHYTVFSPIFCSSAFSRAQIFSSALWSLTLWISFPQSKRPIKRKIKIIVPNILIFEILDMRRKAVDSELNSSRHSADLILCPSFLHQCDFNLWLLFPITCTSPLQRIFNYVYIVVITSCVTVLRY